MRKAISELNGAEPELEQNEDSKYVRVKFRIDDIEN